MAKLFKEKSIEGKDGLDQFLDTLHTRSDRHKQPKAVFTLNVERAELSDLRAILDSAKEARKLKVNLVERGHINSGKTSEIKREVHFNGNILFSFVGCSKSPNPEESVYPIIRDYINHKKGTKMTVRQVKEVVTCTCIRG